MAVELPNEILTFLLGVIGLLTVIAAIYHRKVVSIQNETKRDVTTDRTTTQNTKDINQLNEWVISLQAKIAKLEGAFEQHNKESRK